MENTIERTGLEKMVMNLAMYAIQHGKNIDEENKSRKRKKYFHSNELVEQYYRMATIVEKGHTGGWGGLTTCFGIGYDDCSTLVSSVDYYIRNKNMAFDEAVDVTMEKWNERKEKWNERKV